ncbi:MAG: hypothetical protein JXA01_07870 [Dehalococcoidia bacterium]|nr:hypothetical protein [Dehalococcoidia bacterium]
MTKLVSSSQIMAYASANNWLELYVSDGNVLNVYLTPNGNILEVYFDKNKATLKVLPSYVCK